MATYIVAKLFPFICGVTIIIILWVTRRDKRENVDNVHVDTAKNQISPHERAIQKAAQHYATYITYDDAAKKSKLADDGYSFWEYTDKAHQQYYAANVCIDMISKYEDVDAICVEQEVKRYVEKHSQNNLLETDNTI